MENSLVDLMEKFQKGSKPALHLGPFLPLARIKERGLSFNDIMKDPQAMTEAALMNYELALNRRCYLSISMWKRKSSVPRSNITKVSMATRYILPSLKSPSPRMTILIFPITWLEKVECRPY